MRGIFFDEDTALAVVRALRGQGWEAELDRERLAGEDDDEDHPWAVVTDAPEPVLDVLVDTHDGWLDLDEPAPPGPPLPPLRLPMAPRRLKAEPAAPRDPGDGPDGHHGQDRSAGQD